MRTFWRGWIMGFACALAICYGLWLRYDHQMTEWLNTHPRTHLYFDSRDFTCWEGWK